MSDLERLKQRLVGDAIRENVELIAGRRGVSGPGRRKSRTSRALAWGGGLFGLFATSALGLIWSGWAPSVSDPQISRTEPVEAAPAAQLAELVTTGETSGDPVSPAVAGPEAIPAAMPVEERRFTAPAPLDPSALRLGVRHVILDPGHGGRNPGTRAGELLEKEITLDLALRLRPLLQAAGYDVTLTREQDVDIDLAERVAFANEQRGDLFVSIHVNWLGKKAARGIETFYLGPTDDPVLTEVAGVENQESGYSLADFRRLLAGIYEDVRNQESRSLALAVHGSLLRTLRIASPGLEDRGVKTAPFVVLIGTEMPAVLAEVGSLSDKQDVELFAGEEYRQTIAEALCDGIVGYAAAHARPPARFASTGTTATAGG